MKDGATVQNEHKLAAERVAGQLQRPPVPQIAFTLLMAMSDLIAMTIAIWSALFFVVGSALSPIETLLEAGIAATLAVAALWASARYDITILRRTVLSIATAWAVAFAVFIGMGLLSVWPKDVSEIALPTALCLGATLGFTHGIMGLIARWAQDFGLTDRFAVLIGGGKEAREVLESLNTKATRDIRVVGLFDDRNDARSPDSVMGVPKLGRISDLIPFTQQARIDTVIIAFPLAAERRIRETAELLKVLPLDIRLSGLAFSVAHAQDTGGGLGTQSNLISLADKPLKGGTAMSKRAVDIVGAFSALVLLSPVLLGVALAVKFDSKGPVFFRQKRHGFNSTVIDVLKFRSMYADQSDAAARQVVSRDDPRVTPVGRFIRRWSLDELPQLFNVLKGDLSLVGPRPHAVDATYSQTSTFESLVDGYAARHRVPPGITGWAQINGWRGEIDKPERLMRRVEHDLYYIERSSFWFDIRILASTIPSLFRKDYAY